MQPQQLPKTFYDSQYSLRKYSHKPYSSLAWKLGLSGISMRSRRCGFQSFGFAEIKGPYPTETPIYCNRAAGSCLSLTKRSTWAKVMKTSTLKNNKKTLLR